MPKKTNDLLPRMLFVFSLMFFAFSAGVLFQRFQFPPYQLLHSVYLELRTSPEHLLNDMGIKPTRHLVKNRDAMNQADGHDVAAPQESAIDERVALAPLSGKTVSLDGAGLGVFRALRAESMAPGIRLIFGLTPHTETLFGAMLLSAEGELLHFWPIDYAAIDPDGPSPNNVYVHGSEVFANGDIVVGFDSGRAFGRLDPCGQVVWRRDNQHHHALAVTEDEVLITFQFTYPPDNDKIVFYDAATGNPQREPIDAIGDLFARSDYRGVLGIRDTDQDQRVKESFHFNDVEILSPA